jgi:LPS sulfotransferase NodH
MQKIAKSFPINTNYECKNTVLIAGVGRSGTTWLGNIVNHSNCFRDIFEPFRADHTAVWHNCHCKQYIKPTCKDKEFFKAAQYILSGRVSNKWCNRFNKKPISSKRMVKEIRANFFLKWLKINFPEIPLVFIMRHPCAVAVSRKTLGWATLFEDILSQKQLVDEHLGPFVDEIKKCNDDLDRQIYIWCIENYVAMNQLEGEDFLLVFYEQLCVDPQRELSRIFKHIDCPVTEEVVNVLKKPSALSKDDSAIKSGGDLVSSWKKYVTSSQIQTASKIVSHFGLDRFYDSGVYPIIENKIETVNEL